MTLYGQDYEAYEYDEDGNITATQVVEIHRGQLRMAERLVRKHGNDLRHVHGIGWHVWDGHRWQGDEDKAETRYAVATIKTALAELPLLEGERRDDLHKDIRKVESASGIEGMLKIASATLPVSTASKRLDADPWQFNTPDGTLDLHNGGVKPHDRGDLITKLAGAGIPDDDLGDTMTSTEWTAFLERILPDPDVRSFVQRLFGYAMLGRVTEHVMPIFTGTGANGKGTLRDAVMTAFGDYAVEVDPKILMESKHDRHATFLMELRGRRLIFCSETEKGRRFAEATMKRLVGGDPIQANRMHKDPITFLPSHTLVMLTNHLPIISGDDPAVWRRILVVPFDVVIPEAERDGELPDRLKAAAPAVLAWVYAGWLAYQEQGLNPPDAVRARTDQYRAESDAIGRFMEERVQENKHAHTKARELWNAFTDWCRDNGEQAGTETAFGKTMAARGFAKKRNGRLGMIYPGLMLLTDGDDGDDR